MNNIKKGIIKGYNIPLLPNFINKWYSNPLIRVLRVLGGICAILALTKNYLYLPQYLQRVVLIIGILQLIQIVIISIIKIIYGVNKLINNPKDFEVRIKSI
jgi:hypothetical protein